jgi:hypothetical protein
MPTATMKSPRFSSRKAARTGKVIAVAHQRRRLIDPTTCERDYGPDEIEFMQALERYKRTSGRMFPTCSEVLEVVRSLGYSRVAGG